MSSKDDVITIQIVEALWETIKRDVRPRSPAVQALLQTTRPIGVEGSTVVLLCTSPFHRDNLNKSQNKRIVVEVIRKHIDKIRDVRTTLEVSVKESLDDIINSSVVALPKEVVSRDGVERSLAEAEDEIIRLKGMISTHKRHIRVLEGKEVQFGIHTPTYILLELDDLRHKTEECQLKIDEQKHVALNLIENLVLSLAWERADERNTCTTLEEKCRNNELQIDQTSEHLGQMFALLAKENSRSLDLSFLRITTPANKGEEIILGLFAELQKLSSSLRDLNNELSERRQTLERVNEDFLFATTMRKKIQEM